MNDKVSVVKYYKIHDLELVGRTVDGNPYIYIKHEWTYDIRLMDRIYGYDETESDTPYAMFNDSIMKTVSIITEKEALEFIDSHEILERK
jgi:hypothetical protein